MDVSEININLWSNFGNSQIETYELFTYHFMISSNISINFNNKELNTKIFIDKIFKLIPKQYQNNIKYTLNSNDGSLKIIKQNKKINMDVDFLLTFTIEKCKNNLLGIRIFKHLRKALFDNFFNTNNFIIDIINHNLSNDNTKLNIKINHNLLTKMLHNFNLLLKVDKIDLQHNHLIKIPSWICENFNLNQLNLANNQIKLLPSNLRYLVNLKKLDLSNNQLTNISNCIGFCCSLEWLNLENNKITEFNKSFQKLCYLKYLNCQNNRLNIIPNTFYQIENIEVLNLSNNEITGLNNDIRMLKNLKELNLSNNIIYKLPDFIVVHNNLRFSVFGNNVKYDEQCIEVKKWLKETCKKIHKELPIY